jgi:hypothetical protein
MSDYKCEFCNNEYTNVKILKSHQKTAKFCIEIQKKNQNELSDKTKTNLFFECEYCKDNFTQKSSLERHYTTCKFKEIKIKDIEIEKLKNIINQQQINEHKYIKIIEEQKDQISIYKTELIVKDEKIKMKDEIISKLEKEIDSLKKENKETVNQFLEEEKKLVNTLINKPTITNQQNITNNTINQYNIQPFTDDTILNAYKSYYYETNKPFRRTSYNIITGDKEGFNNSIVFNGIVKKLKPFYGITDKARDKLMYIKDGSMITTTAKEFVNTNIVMNSIDAVLEFISGLIDETNKTMEVGYAGKDGVIKELTDIDKRDLTDTKEGLEYFKRIHQNVKDSGTVNDDFRRQMVQSLMKQGQFIEKQAKLK